MSDLTIYYSDNLPVLKVLPDKSINLIYIDPPFNTGKIQKRTELSTTKNENGDRIGFQNKKYKTTKLETKQYSDTFDDYLLFLKPRLIESKRILTDDGSLFFHIDYREVHYCKILLDQLFGRSSFMNEIIWAYDYGARSKTKWSTKHDNILWYAKDPNSYTFNFEEMDRIPYMSPGLVGHEKAARGKTPTDVFWHTIVPTNGREKTGYPTQKPRGVIDRIVRVHSRPGDWLLDFFAGSGTFGESAMSFDRKCILIDNNPDALRTMETRFIDKNVCWVNWKPFRGEI